MGASYSFLAKTEFHLVPYHQILDFNQYVFIFWTPEEYIANSETNGYKHSTTADEVKYPQIRASDDWSQMLCSVSSYANSVRWLRRWPTITCTDFISPRFAVRSLVYQLFCLLLLTTEETGNAGYRLPIYSLRMEDQDWFSSQCLIWRLNLSQNSLT